MRLLLTCAALALLIGACSSGPTVTSDFDPAAEAGMRAYKTYNWLPPPKGGDPRIDNEILVARIIRTGDQVLRGKGFTKTSTRPDFVVGYHLSVQDKMSVSYVNNYYGYGYGSYWRGGMGMGMGMSTSTPIVREYEMGTLIFDIVDAAKNQLVWRGTATGELGDPPDNAQERDERVREVVAAVLADFPPPVPE